MMNKHILFVHIPKTAGTSFRKAAQSYFGDENTLYDYGRESVETSQTILQNIYEQQDFYSFSKQISRHPKLFLSGHVPVGKYMSLFKTTNVVTFVREPIAQVVSHYAHYKAHNGYNKSFQEFIQDRRFSDLQSRMLQAKPIELFGFVGLTEEYDRSLKIINHYFGTDIKYIEENKNETSAKIMESLDKDTINLIKKYNQKDIELYKKAKVLFNAHKKAYEAKRPYLYKLVQEANDKIARGVAFYRHSDDAAELNVQINNITKTVEAKALRPGLLVHNLPRDGYVGYECKEESK